MSNERSNNALFEIAILERKPEDAKRSYELMVEEFDGQLPIIFEYHAARIAFAANDIEAGLASLQSWRKADGSPFGVCRSIQALLDFRIRKDLADAWFAELQRDIENYVAVSDDDLSKSYYEIQISDLKKEFAQWAAELQ